VRRAGSRSAYRAMRLGAAFFFPQVLGQTQVVNWAITGAWTVLHVLGHTQGRNWAVFGAGAALNSESVKMRLIMETVYTSPGKPPRRTVNPPF